MKPITYENYQDEAIKKELAKILSNRYNRNLKITNFTREDIKKTHRSIVARLYVQLDDSDKTTVIVKQMNPDWIHKDFISINDMLGRILSGKQVAPELYGTVNDPKKGRFWIFMEDLGKNLITGQEDFKNEEMKHYLGFVKKVAKIHLAFADHDERKLIKIFSPLIAEPTTRKGWRDRDESAIKKIPSNIKTLAQTGKFPWIDEIKAPLIDILKPCLNIIDHTILQPFVFGHWDMAPEENFVIGREGEEPIYYFIDWDEIYYGPALSNLPIDRSNEDEELVLVEQYWECVKGNPFVPSDKDECFLTFMYCRLMGYIRGIHRLSGRVIETQFNDIGASERMRQLILSAIKLAEKIQISA